MADLDWPRVLRQHLAFLRLTTIELRRIADREPEAAVYLRHIADQIDGEAADVAAKAPDYHASQRPTGFV